MHGLGDNLHQRAIIRELLKRDFRVKLETSWPCVYADLVAGDALQFVRKPVALRTQLKNAEREKDKFIPGVSPHHVARSIRIAYNRSTVAAMPSQTILEAMYLAAGMPEAFANADYRLSVPREWTETTPHCFDTGKPIMIYRPLVYRPEWRGSGLRNADPGAYAELVGTIRDSFYVVSIADLEPNREWIVGPELVADATFHHGELSFEQLAAIFAKASLVVTSGGFPAILGQVVSTPTVSILGGYEPAGWVSAGAKFTPYLGIDPITPCTCATSGCTRPCSKAIDLPRAREALAGFISAQIGVSTPTESRPLSEMFTPAPSPPTPGVRPAPRIMPRVTVGSRPVRPGNPALLYQRRPPVRI